MFMKKNVDFTKMLKKNHHWSCSEATWTKCCCESKQSYLLFFWELDDTNFGWL